MADGWKRKMISCSNEIFVVLISVLIFLSAQYGKDDKAFKRDIIVLISFSILFVSTSFLVNIGKEKSLPGFRILLFSATLDYLRPDKLKAK